MSLPALHLLTLTDSVDVKREPADTLPQPGVKRHQKSTVNDGENERGGEDWSWSDSEDEGEDKGGGQEKDGESSTFWEWSDGEDEGEGEETEEVPKDADDYEEPKYPKILILDFDHTMHQGIVKKYITSTYAGTANDQKTEEEQQTYESELATDANTVREGKHARVGVAGMTSDNPLFEHLTQEEYVELFGGQEQIDRMHAFFNNLDNQWVSSNILTFSPEATVIKALKAVDLLKWFTEPEEKSEQDPEQDPVYRIYGKTFFDNYEEQIKKYAEEFPDESEEKQIKAAEGTGVDKSAGVAIILDQLFQAYQTELPTKEDRSNVIVVYVDDDYENVTAKGSGVVPVVFKDPEFNMHKSTGIVHKWQNIDSQKKKDQMNSFPEPFSKDFEEIELALELEGWVKELSSTDLANLSKWWNRFNKDDIMTPDEMKEGYAIADRETGLKLCQRARALYWEELDGEDEYNEE